MRSAEVHLDNKINSRASTIIASRLAATQYGQSYQKEIVRSCSQPPSPSDLTFLIVTFHNISNPYEDPIEPNSTHSGRDMTYPSNPYQQPSSQEYASNAVAQLQAAVSSMPHPHSLHALSQAIELHTPPQANMLPRPTPNPENPYEGPFEDGPSGVESSTPFATTPAMATAKKALSTPTEVDPSIDPDLMRPSRRHERESPTNDTGNPSHGTGTT